MNLGLERGQGECTFLDPLSIMYRVVSSKIRSKLCSENILFRGLRQRPPWL